MEINWDKINKMTDLNSNTNDMRIALEILKKSNIDVNDIRIREISWRIDGDIADEYFEDNYAIIKRENDAFSKYKIHSWK